MRETKLKNKYKGEKLFKKFSSVRKYCSGNAFARQKGTD